MGNGGKPQIIQSITHFEYTINQLFLEIPSLRNTHVHPFVSKDTMEFLSFILYVPRVAELTCELGPLVVPFGGHFW